MISDVISHRRRWGTAARVEAVRSAQQPVQEKTEAEPPNEGDGLLHQGHFQVQRCFRLGSPDAHVPEGCLLERLMRQDRVSYGSTG